MKISANTKRYLFSSMVTFLTGFLGVLSVSMDKFTLDNLQNGVFIGVIMVAIRVGVKATFEYLVTILKKYKTL